MLREKQCEIVNDLLKYLVDGDMLCGYNLAIVTPDEEYVRSYGYRQKVGELLEADRDTIYDLASLSKVVSTTTCILKLVESKEISLNDTVHSLLPRFEDEGVTVLECLTHSSGLRDIDDYKKLSDEQFLDATYKAKPLEGQKGKIFYADINFILLGFVIAGLKGSLDGFAREAVFRPLGMNHTCYNPADVSNCAATEVTSQRGIICGKVHDGKAYRLGGVGGSAGVFSCIDDLIIFVRMMMDDENGFLSKQTREMLRKSWCDVGADRRTLGWVMSTDKSSMGLKFSEHALFHTGFTGGSILIDLDSKLSVVILCNRIHPNRNNSSILKFRDIINTFAYDTIV